MLECKELYRFSKNNNNFNFCEVTEWKILSQIEWQIDTLRLRDFWPAGMIKKGEYEFHNRARLMAIKNESTKENCEKEGEVDNFTKYC
jgi:hypothetical protein